MALWNTQTLAEGGWGPARGEGLGKPALADFCPQVGGEMRAWGFVSWPRACGPALSNSKGKWGERPGMRGVSGLLLGERG